MYWLQAILVSRSETSRRVLRLQFSLATLLAVVTLFAFWLGNNSKDVQKQASIVGAVLAKGGSVQYDCIVDAEGRPVPKPGVLEPVPLRLCNEHVCANVTGIRARNQRFGDADLEGIAELSHVKTLDLAAAAVTNVGLAQIADSSSIELLILSHTRVQGPALAQLDSVPIKWLMLDGTDIDDGCVASLQRIESLVFLDVTGTRITDAGMSRLQASLPDCQILRP
jgi:hypothetical protein